MIIWIDLAEQQEMLAKAWTLRAPAQPERLRLAYLDDAAEAAATAADYRGCAEDGVGLEQDLAAFLLVVT